MAKELIEGQTIKGKTIYLDQNAYKGCTFIDCEIIYTGGEWQLDNNHFEGFNLNFEGAADRTLVFLQWLYVNGAGSVVETIFEEIRATKGIRGDRS